MRKQQGLTLIGMLLTVVMVILAGIIIMRVIPVYIQNYEVKRSVTVLGNLDAAEFSLDASANANVLRKRLTNQFTINGLDELKPEVDISPKGESNFEISIKYTVIKPLISNVSLMFEFHEIQEVSVGTK